MRACVLCWSWPTKAGQRDFDHCYGPGSCGPLLKKCIWTLLHIGRPDHDRPDPPVQSDTTNLTAYSSLASALGGVGFRICYCSTATKLPGEAHHVHDGPCRACGVAHPTFLAPPHTHPNPLHCRNAKTMCRRLATKRGQGRLEAAEEKTRPDLTCSTRRYSFCAFSSGDILWVPVGELPIRARRWWPTGHARWPPARPACLTRCASSCDLGGTPWCRRSADMTG